MGRPRAVRPQGCTHAEPRITTVDGQLVVGLDWSSHSTAGQGQRCWICQRPSLLVDCDGRPCHKTCAERQTAQDLAAAGRQYGRPPAALAS